MFQSTKFTFASSLAGVPVRSQNRGHQVLKERVCVPHDEKGINYGLVQYDH